MMDEQFCPGCGADHVDDHCRECQDDYCDQCLGTLPLTIDGRAVEIGPLCPHCRELLATVQDSAGRTIDAYKLERELPYKCGACGARFANPADCTAHIRTCTRAAYLLGALDTGIAVVTAKGAGE